MNTNIENIQIFHVVALEIEGVIEQFIGQLKTSGYTRKQAKGIVVCGVEEETRDEAKGRTKPIPGG